MGYKYSGRDIGEAAPGTDCVRYKHDTPGIISTNRLPCTSRFEQRGHKESSIFRCIYRTCGAESFTASPTNNREGFDQGVTNKCRLSWLTKSVLVCDPKYRGSWVSANEYSWAHGAQINFGDLTPYLTNGFDIVCEANIRGGLKTVHVVFKVPVKKPVSQLIRGYFL